MYNFVIVTLIKNEHDYINQYIEHHLNLGFEYFYLIIDNLDYEQINYKEYILEIYLDKIKFFYLDKNFASKTWLNNRNNGIYDTSIFIDYFNTTVFQEIDSDWIFMIPLDSFAYFNGNQIGDFLSNIDEDTTQIALPWFSVINQMDFSNEDFCHNLSQLYHLIHNHTYPAAKKKNISGLSGNTHFFNSKKLKQKIFLPDNKYHETENLDITSEIFNRSTFNINDKDHPKNFIIHVQLRNLDEIIIKDFFSWNIITSSNKEILKNLIIKKNIQEFNQISRSLRINLLFSKFNKHNTYLNIKKYKNKNTTTYSSLIIQKLLDELNITLEEYNEFKKWILNKIKNEIIIE